LGVSNGANRVLVHSVSDDSFASRNLALEPIWCLEVHKVAAIARWHRTPNPHEIVRVYRNGELIGKPGPVELLRIPLLAWNLTGLVRAAINAVNRGDEDFITFVKISPNNLVEEIQVRNKAERWKV
jgi:hypothetical protein